MFDITRAALKAKALPSHFSLSFFFYSLDNDSWLSVSAVSSLFSVIASEMCYFFSVPLLCYAGLSAAGARAGTSSGGKKTLKCTVKSVCAVTSAEPSNELVALPESRSQETNHSSRFETEGHC